MCCSFPSTAGLFLCHDNSLLKNKLGCSPHPGDNYRGQISLQSDMQRDRSTPWIWPASCPLLTAARNHIRSMGEIIFHLPYQHFWSTFTILPIQIAGKLKESGQKPLWTIGILPKRGLAWSVPPLYLQQDLFILAISLFKILLLTPFSMI